jgi:hypothetical protein
MKNKQQIYKTFSKALLFMSVSDRRLIRDLLISQNLDHLPSLIDWDGTPMIFVITLIGVLEEQLSKQGVILWIQILHYLAIKYETNEKIKLELQNLEIE